MLGTLINCFFFQGVVWCLQQEGQKQGREEMSRIEEVNRKEVEEAQRKEAMERQRKEEERYRELQRKKQCQRRRQKRNKNV